MIELHLKWRLKKEMNLKKNDDNEGDICICKSNNKDDTQGTYLS